VAHTWTTDPGFKAAARSVAVATALIDAYEWSADPRFLEEAGRMMDFVMNAFREAAGTGSSTAFPMGRAGELAIAAGICPRTPGRLTR